MKILFASKYFFYSKKQTKKATGTNQTEGRQQVRIKRHFFSP